jgi:hypothetical protein
MPAGGDGAPAAEASYDRVEYNKEGTDTRAARCTSLRVGDERVCV